jgi:hypothetical protein
MLPEVSRLIGLVGVYLLFAGPNGVAKAAVPSSLGSAQSALKAGRCQDATDLFLSARAAGDSSAALLAGLAQALECTGRMEEALGATYLRLGKDTTGRIDLLIFRDQLLRSLGLGDMAKQTETEMGIVEASSEMARSGWTWQKRPTLTANLGWSHEFDAPGSPFSLNHNDSTLLRNSGTVPVFASEDALAQVASDSILLEGGSWDLSGALSWGGGGDRGGIWLGPTGSVALDDDSLGWRSAGAGFDLNWLWIASSQISVQGDVSGQRTWFAADSGPFPVEDDLGATFAPQWNRSSWEISLPQTIRTLRTNSSAWTWTGSHGLGISKTVNPMVKLSASAAWSWNIDPSGPVDDEVWSMVVEGDSLAAGKGVLDVGLYAPNLTSGKSPIGKFTVPAYLATVSEAQLQGFAYPLSRNTDWTQPGVGAAVVLGPWSSLSLVLSAQWAETIYAHDQEGVNVDPSMADHLADTVLLVLRDTATKKEFLVGSTKTDAPLVAWSPWRIHRVDQVWSAQTVLLWRPRKWLSFRASWAWTRNVSNVAQFLEGASYVRNLVAGSGAVSW